MRKQSIFPLHQLYPALLSRRYLLQEKLLLHTVLPPYAARLHLLILGQLQAALPEAVSLASTALSLAQVKLPIYTNSNIQESVAKSALGIGKELCVQEIVCCVRDTSPQISEKLLMQVWASSESMDRLPASRQAYMTACLIICMQRVGKKGIEAMPGLLKNLLEGVSTRLNNPISSLR